MINQVRNTVLSVLNKNNYGYISPADFNLYAENAQMELYEEYFSSYNKAINMENARSSGTDYADIESPLAETLEIFLVSKNLVHISGSVFYAPSLTTTGDTAYYLLKLLCRPTVLAKGKSTSVSASKLINSSATFTLNGISEGDIVVNKSANTTALVVSVVSNTTLLLDSNIFTATNQDYVVISQIVKESEKVSVGKITSLNNSNLTKPNKYFPAYTLESDRIKIYPNSIDSFGQVEAVYFRHPKVPKWTYLTLANGEPVFNQSLPDYQDFEMPEEDAYKLAMKILQYCGISIRESEVVQYSIMQEQHEQPTFSQQQ